LEDLQWLDPDSEELVKLLTRSVKDHPLAIVCTGRYRDDGSRVALPVDPDVPQQVLELDTLLPDGVRALAAQMLAPGEGERPEGELSEELAAFLVEKTGGNPFFVEQLLLDLRERGTVMRGTGDEWALAGEEVAEVPTTIGAVLIARLDRLVARIKAVVQAAAVLGREFEVQVLSQMLRGEEGVPARVRRAEEERIWTALSEVRYIFRHALLRDAAYDMQLRARLRELHRLAGKAIEQVYAHDLAPYYADLAYHYGRAEEVEGERLYARLAGEQAASQFANVEAVRYLSRALELTPEDDPLGRYSLLLAREKVHDLRGDREAQAQDLQALMALAEASNDDRQQAGAGLRQAHYAHVTSDWPAAITTAQRVVTLAQASGDARGEAEGCLQCGQSLTMQGDLAAARQQIEQSLALARIGGMQRLEAQGLRSLGVVHWYLGDFTRAGACFEGSLQICRQVGDRQAEGAAVGNLGLVCRHSDLAQAVHYLKQALTISRLTGDRKGQGADLLNLGSVYAEQGEYSKARPCYEQALAITRAIEDRWNEANALTGLGGVCLRHRDHDAAENYFEQALQIYRDVGERYNEGQALGRLGVLYQEQGDYSKARRYLEACLDIGRQTGNRPGEGIALLNLGTVWRCLGDYAQAGLCLEQSLDIFRQIDAKQLESVCLAELGTLYHLVGDDQAAQTHSQQALAIAREVGEQPVQGHALANLGRALMVLGHPVEAAQAYVQALDLRRQLGLHQLAIESQAGLAGVYLAQGELGRAQDQVEEILAYLETDTLDSTEERFQVYLTCYRVLEAGQDPRAQELLATAYTLLQARADAIEEAEWRRSYLENVPHHREIMAAYQAT
jgi:tetratricopeptide (TPR) repeat protein